MSGTSIAGVTVSLARVVPATTDDGPLTEKASAGFFAVRVKVGVLSSVLASYTLSVFTSEKTRNV